MISIKIIKIHKCTVKYSCNYILNLSYIATCVCVCVCVCARAHARVCTSKLTYSYSCVQHMWVQLKIQATSHQYIDAYLYLFSAIIIPAQIVMGVIIK